MDRRSFLKGLAGATGAGASAIAGCVARKPGTHPSLGSAPVMSSTSGRVSPKQATTVARTADQLVSALLNKGATIWIPGDAKIDMSDYSGLYIADGVTIASNRGLNGAGGLINYSSTGQNLFVSSPKKLRVTGVRFQGPRTDFYDPGEQGAIRDNTQCFDLMGGPVIIDNCEFYGWQKAALHFQTDENIRSWIHHNYIHHNQMQHRGYGIDLVTGQHLIEWNTFNANRHSIAGSGFPSCGYEARYNVQGPKTVYQPFDMHSAAEVQPGNYDPPLAGKYVRIHHNVSFTERSVTVGIRGVPRERSVIANNWFRDVPSSRDVPMGVVQQQIDRTPTDIVHLAQYRNMTVKKNSFGKQAARKGLRTLKQAASQASSNA